jgi:hypothetical protein
MVDFEPIQVVKKVYMFVCLRVFLLKRQVKEKREKAKRIAKAAKMLLPSL